MYPAAVQKPAILSALPGRLRLRLPEAQRAGAVLLLRQLSWVRHVEQSPVTGNLLVCFDPHVPVARLVNLLAATDGGAVVHASRLPAPGSTADDLRDGGKLDTLRRVVGCLRTGFEAVDFFAGRRGTLVAAALTAVAPAAVRLALDALLGRDATKWLTLLTEVAAAVLTGASLALALAAVDALLGLACRAASAASGPPPTPQLLAA